MKFAIEVSKAVLAFLIVGMVGVGAILYVASTNAEAVKSSEAAQATRASVLVVEHVPDGTTVERTGFLTDLRINAAAVLVEYVDDGDPLFHNGFECGASACP